ncbi:MAG: phosphodiesterase [Mycobacterium sp.]
MHISDLTALPVRLGSAVRGRRLFHPVGVLAEGVLKRTALDSDGLPMRSCDVIGRVSKGIGIPGGGPDIAGLAFRIPPPQDLRSCGPWDVLLASTAAGSRFGLAPVTSWSDATFSSLMPLRYRGRVWWLRARLTTEIAAKGLALDTIENEIDSNGIQFDIEQTEHRGEFRPLAQLTLRNVDPSCDDIAFDPALHTDCDVQLLPRWLANFRRAAYRRSRQGRDAQ